MAKNDTATADKTDAEKAKPLVYVLSEPVEWNKQTYVELPYRKATGRDMKKMLNIPKSGDRYHAALKDIFEMPEGFWDVVPGGDYMACTDIIDGFFARPKSD